VKSTSIDQHIVELLELVSYLRTFQDDPALKDKLHKLKRDRFWPVFSELAMAARMKRACKRPQTVSLSPEAPGSIGDFVLATSGIKLACECTRLGNSSQIDDPRIYGEHLANKIAATTEQIPIRLIFKVRSTAALNGATYNLALRLLRKCLADIKRSQPPTVYYEGETSISCGELTENAEPLPFRMIDGVVANVVGTDWDSVSSFQAVPAADEEEVSKRFKAGERFRKFERVRLFLKFGPHEIAPEIYDRLSSLPVI
jgi:hypothetical protein